MKLRVLLVDEDLERLAMLKAALTKAGYEIAAEVRTSVDLLEQVRAAAPDVIVIDRNSPDRDTLEHVCMVTRDAPRPILLFTDDENRASIRAAVQAGVSAYVVGGLSPERIRPIIEVAMARFEEHQALRYELEQTKATLAERKRIERAKGIVMKSRGVSEDEAYRLLRSLAMQRGERIAAVAESVIAMADLLT